RAEARITRPWSEAQPSDLERRAEASERNTMTAEARYRALVADIEAEFPGFRLVKKDASASQRVIAALLRIVTLGAQSRYLTSYQTTIGRTVYVTPDWDRIPALQRYVTLRHERVHLRQFRRYTLVGMALLYLLLPLPIGVAWFRMRFGREAAGETLGAMAEVSGPGRPRAPALRAGILAQFPSGAYGWMWPFPRGLERWYDGVFLR